MTIPPVGTVPPGRMTRTAIKYPNVASGPTRPNVDVTQWANVFGYDSVQAQGPAAWPGLRGTAPAIYPFAGGGASGVPAYIALEFTPQVKAQVTVSVSTYYGWPVDWSYSTSPGYFAPVRGTCSGTAGAGEAFTKVSSDPAKVGCPAPIGQRMYLNIRFHNPNNATTPVAFTLQY